MSEQKTVIVGAVGALIERQGKFLMMKEVQRHIANHPDDGKWNIPAGRIEFGMDPLQVVKNEVLEETGYAFTPTHVLGLYSLVREDIAPELGLLQHVLKVMYVGDISSEPQVPLSSDSAGIRWFTAAEIQAMDRHTLRSLDIKTMVSHYLAGTRYPLAVMVHTVSPRD